MRKMVKKTVFTLALAGMVAAFSGNSQNSQAKSETGHSPGSFLESGTFIIGANYWASHAGTAMWSDWRADVVEKDFKTLSENGIKYLRVFPLWSDFQPISLLRGGGGSPAEYRWGERSLTDDAEGKAGVSHEAILHFEELTRIAEKYDMKLIVGLITGWMSGRLFVPPALEGKKILSDPDAMMWEVRFVKYFVSRFRDTPSIIAWDLGNECNSMEAVSSQSTAWNWISAITNAIKSEDKSRLVVSGMHSLKTEGIWTIEDQAEVTDVLCTHAYPSPTYGSDKEPINTIRTVLHPTANTVMWQDIGGKPCFLEETGTFGPMQGSPEITTDYARNSLFSLWAHNCKGFMWWCAFEQSHLKHAPYDWVALEGELGLFFPDYTSKPIVNTLHHFNDFLERFPYQKLPERIIDAVCVLPMDPDSWQTAFSTFLLAKQAGIDIEYQTSTQPIKDSKLYFLPGLSGSTVFSRFMNQERFDELLGKVRDGATLYISVGNGLLRSFNDITGLQVQTREKNLKNDLVTIKETYDRDHIEIHMPPSFKLNLKAITARVLGSDQNGNPAFTVSDYGKGKVYFLNYPIEKSLFSEEGAFYKKTAEPYYQIYKHIRESIPSGKVVTGNSPMVGLTEHVVDENTRIIVAVNYEPAGSKTDLTLETGWEVAECFYGEMPSIDKKTGKVQTSLNKNDAVVFSIKKNK
jgi:hypothetical protein